ncbi:LuxR C-terminal-related transcriptional regulator [Acinetobacter sp. VNH17]|uniref:LuxR C-terminal-related transcriptional regulator n=1 Tax=Acinetobacter thutiue TaxID=2998078 RepID=A0ABT7WN94_9GAMM|nr:LuxR family transcriptional regulator [Acinetobacter thutiue]MCY6412031.1 LuxR C-terminal-related transcriptional regulator [Acinetobacter thutiue]MDN0014135.1 LuxR C-terminal-related transcriptional regulator [Acinetobacter thutiue]
MGPERMQQLENHIVGMIYDAALDHQLWTRVLQSIVEYTQSNTAIFTAVDQLNPSFDFVYTYNIPESALEAYQDECINVIDMKLHVPLWQQAGIGGVVHADLSHYADMPEYSDEYIFHDRCLRTAGISRFGAVLLEQGKYQWSVFAVHRNPKAPPYTVEELQLLARLGKHLRRALQIHRQLSIVRQENSELYQLIDGLRTGVIILDEQMNIAYSNLQAKHILEHSALLSIDQYNHLYAPAQFQAQLHRLIQSALFKDNTVNAEDVGGVLGIYGQQGEHPIMLTVMPLSDQSHIFQIDQRQRVALFITEVHEKCQLAEQFVQQLYGLSHREVQICVLFFKGLKTEEISTHLGLTYHSVRTYFKTIYAKTQCNSQAELLKLLAGFTLDFEHIV